MNKIKVKKDIDMKKHKSCSPAEAVPLRSCATENVLHLVNGF